MADTKNKNIEDFFTTTSPDSEGVKEFLKQQEVSKSQEQEPQQQEPIAPQSPDAFNTTWGSGEDSEDEVLPEENPMKNMALAVSDSVVPITDTDKRMYLKATLANEPVELKIEMANGFVFRVRSLTAYESDVVSAAALWHFKDQSGMSLSELLGMGAAEQYRLAMQVTHVNGVPVDYVHFRFERGKSNLSADAKLLRERSDDNMMNMSGTLYGLYLRAMHVFNAKMTKLQDAAFSLNFWPPDSTD